jgi:hypothetical protein
MVALIFLIADRPPVAPRYHVLADLAGGLRVCSASAFTSGDHRKAAAGLGAPPRWWR